MNIIGIDVGNSGGIALLNDYGVPIMATDMPNTTKAMYDYIDSLLHCNMNVKIYIEKARSRPTDSHKSAWGNGFSYGKITTVLDLSCRKHDVKYIEVDPRTWKSAFKLDSDKLKSKNLCDTLWYEQRVKDMTWYRDWETPFLS